MIESGLRFASGVAVAFGLASASLVVPSFPATAHAQSWQGATAHGRFAYFAFASTRTIERFDMNASKWRKSLPLHGAPTALAADDAGLYVAYGASVWRYDHNGSNAALVLNTSDSIDRLFVSGENIVALSDRAVWVADRFGAGPIDFDSISGTFEALSMASRLGRLFGYDRGASRDVVAYLAIQTSGDIGAFVDQSAVFTAVGRPRATWVFPGEENFADDAGTVRSTDDLSSVGTIAGGRIMDMAFRQNTILVLRNGAVDTFSNALQYRGTAMLEGAPVRIFAFGGAAFVFADGETRLVDAVSIDQETEFDPDLAEPVDPNGLAFQPDAIEVGSDGIVYLLSITHRNVFRWDSRAQHFLTSIPLERGARFLSYSGVTNRLYIGYSSGLIAQVRLDDDLAYEFFLDVSARPCGLAAAGEFVFVCDESRDGEHATFDAMGNFVSASSSNIRSREFLWSAANRRIYHMSFDSAENTLFAEPLNEDGILGDTLSAIDAVGEEVDSSIRVHPDGSVVVLGSGRVLDGVSLELIDELSMEHDAAGWRKGVLLTAKAGNVNSDLRTWSTSYELEGQSVLPGRIRVSFATEAA